MPRERPKKWQKDKKKKKRSFYDNGVGLKKHKSQIRKERIYYVIIYTKSCTIKVANKVER